jgi:hypothetical protein
MADEPHCSSVTSATADDQFTETYLFSSGANNRLGLTKESEPGLPKSITQIAPVPECRSAISETELCDLEITKKDLIEYLLELGYCKEELEDHILNEFVTALNEKTIREKTENSIEVNSQLHPNSGTLPTPLDEWGENYPTYNETSFYEQQELTEHSHEPNEYLRRPEIPIGYGSGCKSISFPFCINSHSSTSTMRIHGEKCEALRHII